MQNFPEFPIKKLNTQIQGRIEVGLESEGEAKNSSSDLERIFSDFSLLHMQFSSIFINENA